VATINPCLHEARAVEPVVEEELLAEIRNTDLLHADETSWKERGQLLRLWVFTCATTTVFTIGRRTQELLHGMLGAAIGGWLMSDGYWAYRDYDKRLRCLTHLLRKARGLQESLDRKARDFGDALRHCLETAMERFMRRVKVPRRCRCANNMSKNSTRCSIFACAMPRPSTRRLVRLHVSCSTIGTPSGSSSITLSCP
jgi:transposase